MRLKNMLKICLVFENLCLSMLVNVVLISKKTCISRSSYNRLYNTLMWKAGNVLSVHTITNTGTVLFINKCFTTLCRSLSAVSFQFCQLACRLFVKSSRLSPTAYAYFDHWSCHVKGLCAHLGGNNRPFALNKKILCPRSICLLVQ